MTKAAIQAFANACNVTIKYSGKLRKFFVAGPGTTKFFRLMKSLQNVKTGRYNSKPAFKFGKATR